MKKTNRTYHVYVSVDNGVENYCGVIAMGTKAEMVAAFEQAKNNVKYDYVALSKWNEKYNCWYTVEKFYASNGGN